MIILNLKNDIFSDDFDLSTHLINEYDDFYHTHTYIEIFYVIDGTIKHSLNGVVSTLRPGDVYLLRPGDIHCFLRDRGNTSHHRDIMITEKQWKRACDYIGLNPIGYLGGKTVSAISSNQIMQFEQILSKISANATKKVLHNAYINLLCANLATVFFDEKLDDTQRKYPIWLKQLLDKFNMPDYFLSGLDTVLSCVNYDRSYVCRVFKKYIGMTMTDYLNLLRLNYAAMLLQTKNDSITRIAFDSGFPNISYFNRCFKRRYGITPSEFQRNPITISVNEKIKSN